MAKTWLSISVELLGGRGVDLWPYPGRVFAVGPSHTFNDFAVAINSSFARWDLNHVDQFTFTNGTVVTDPHSALDTLSAGAGPVLRLLNQYSTKVSQHAKAGEEFQFIFDLGDNWAHRCTVEAKKIDPIETVGIRPKTPTAYWGWGNMPDQYGRRCAQDDGESALPRKPKQPDPMESYMWPTYEAIPAAAVECVREAIAKRDSDAFYNAMVGHTIDDHLQEFAAASPMLLDTRSDESEAIVLSFINRLSWRGEPGDAELADGLLEKLRAM